MSYIEKPQMKFDELSMYFGDDYKVNDYITIHQPTIGEIIQFGENRMYSSINPFTSNPTTYRVALWKIGTDWNKISNYDLFLLLYKSITKENGHMIFGDFDFETLLPETIESGEIVLKNQFGDIVIDSSVYLIISEYLRLMFNQYPIVEKAKGKETKKWMIDADIRKFEEKEKESKHSTLLPLISALLNHPGFKYKKNELREVGIVEFFDSVQRLQLYESVKAFMSGAYSGMVDTSKIDIGKEMNWLRDLHSV